MPDQDKVAVDTAEPAEPAFGCARCYGTDAEATLTYLARNRTDATVLVDDSHFVVTVAHCAACAQPLVSVFTEFVDFSHGDDAQYRTLMPVTATEKAALLRHELAVTDIGSLGGDRRHLNSDWPSGGPHRVYWQTGVFTVQEGH